MTIGLAFLVAILQTAWHRNGNPEYRRVTRFFGALLLINVAVGVVTGLVQEFEFGMNWSSYPRLVGASPRGLIWPGAPARENKLSNAGGLIRTTLPAVLLRRRLRHISG